MRQYYVPGAFSKLGQTSRHWLHLNGTDICVKYFICNDRDVAQGLLYSTCGFDSRFKSHTYYIFNIFFWIFKYPFHNNHNTTLVRLNLKYRWVMLYVVYFSLGCQVTASNQDWNIPGVVMNQTGFCFISDTAINIAQTTDFFQHETKCV